MKHKMRFILLVVLGGVSSAAYAEIYQCKDANGAMSFQDQPCENETVKVTGTKSGTQSNAQSLSSDKMLEVLARMTGESVDQMQDPKYRQAAEALVVTDVSKAYAFTKLHGAPVPYCDGSVAQALADYESKASEAISLGKHYYTNGIDVTVGDQSFKHTGAELTYALDQSIAQKIASFESMDASAMNRICEETIEALATLSQVYSN
ncbi:MAG: DUF4124 domain-containing protein [bacterium]